MIMTFKPNIPERWLEKPEQLPDNSIAGVGTILESKEYDPMMMTDRNPPSLDKGDLDLLKTKSFGKKNKSFSMTQTLNSIAGGNQTNAQSFGKYSS